MKLHGIEGRKNEIFQQFDQQKMELIRRFDEAKARVAEELDTREASDISRLQGVKYEVEQIYRNWCRYMRL